jgi:hypothetical protein
VTGRQRWKPSVPRSSSGWFRRLSVAMTSGAVKDFASGVAAGEAAFEQTEIGFRDLVDAGDEVVLRLSLRARGGQAASRLPSNTRRCSHSTRARSFAIASSLPERQPSKPPGCGSRRCRRSSASRRGGSGRRSGELALLDAAAQPGARPWGSLGRAGCAIRVRQFTVRNPRVCSSALMLVLILTILVLLSSVLALSLLDRNALR